ncbi:MAG: LysR family transcriptional regulator [Raoultibacter sp.]|jgi:DNA-binding transcriptional LysR family regulator
MNDMSLKYRVFLETAQQKSLTRAAQKTGYTQSGISHILDALEKDWGTTLLLRNKKGSVLTPEGEHLLPYVQAVLQAEELLREQVEALKGLEAGLIRIGSFSSVSQNLLPQIIRAYQEQHPAINFEILHGTYADIEAWLSEDRIDLGFLRLPVKDAFDCKLFFEDEIFTITPETYMAENDTYLSFAELEQNPFIMIDMKDSNDFSNYFKKHGITPEVRYTTHEDAVVMAMVESHLGFSLAYGLALKRNPYRVAVWKLEKPASRKIVTATRKGQHKTLAVESFLHFLEEHPLKESGDSARKTE